MRITLLVNHDLPSLLALNYLSPSFKEHNTSVFFTNGAATAGCEKLAKLAMFDSAQTAASFPLTSFKELLAEPLNQINSKDYQRFANTKPDLVVSIRHMSILKQRVIETPKLGVINLHSGLLPAYQGVMATFWALLNKDKVIGTTVHAIEDNNIDTGSIIFQSLTKANYERSYFWNVLNLYKAGCKSIVRAVEQLDSGKPLMSEAQSGQANYYSYPNSSDINRCPVPLFNDNDNAAHFF